MNNGHDFEVGRRDYEYNRILELTSTGMSTRAAKRKLKRGVKKKGSNKGGRRNV